MKPRSLNTTARVIVTDYTMTHITAGLYLYSFHPATTKTCYQFFAGSEPRLEEGKTYNVGYHCVNDTRWVDPEFIAPAESVDPIASHRVARALGEQRRAEETRKSNQRISHTATDGDYLGAKYAWRIYGMAIPRKLFYLYLQAINHPWIECTIQKPDSIETRSIAYKDEGLDIAMDNLIRSLIRIVGDRFCSPKILSRQWFIVKGIEAITDKK